MPRLLKFQPRLPQPLTPSILSQSQINQKQYSIPFAYLSQFPSLEEDDDISRMNKEASNRSIDVKEDISAEMCRMLKLRAENWGKMMKQVGGELPGDLDHVDPLSYTKPLYKYASTFEGVEIIGRKPENDEDNDDEAPRTPERNTGSGTGHSGHAGGQVGGVSSLDGVMETFISPSHEAIRSKIEGYEAEESATSPINSSSSSSSNNNSNNNNNNNNKNNNSSSSSTGKGESNRGGDAKQHEVVEANGDREEVHPHRTNGGQEKSSSNLHKFAHERFSVNAEEY